MTFTTAPLGLHVPKLIKPEGSPFITHPKKVRKWIAALPMGHIGETSRFLHNALVELNQLQLPLEDRFAILELLGEPGQYVISCLKEHFSDCPLPLSEKNHKIAALVQDFLNQYAIGYKIIVETMLSTGVRPVDNHLVLSIHRAMQYSTAELLNAYLVYAASPRYVWEELHKLYHLAFTTDLHTVKIRRIHGGPIEARDIDDLYKQSLLLALANPYQLVQEEIKAIQKSLPYWTPFCTLNPISDASDPPGLFAVALGHDEPPIYHGNLNRSTKNYLILDTSKLTNQLKSLLSCPSAQFSSAPLKEAVEGLSTATLKRMLLSWGLVSRRNFPRRDQSADTQIKVGLIETFRLLDHVLNGPGHEDDDDIGASRASFTSKPVSTANANGKRDDLWDFGVRAHVNATAQSSVTLDQQNGTVSSAGVKIHHRINITNESAGGFCLLWKNDASGSVRVGDLLCLYDAENALNHYNICIVRWMKNVDDIMVLGVEILSAVAKPARTKILRADTLSIRGYVGGLLLPTIPAVNRPSTLITSTLYNTGDVVELKTANHESMIQLTQLLETSKTFKQFQFVEVQEHDRTMTAGDFESIWSSL